MAGGQQGGIVGGLSGGDEGLGQVRIAREVEMRGPSLDTRQQQVLDGIEADPAALHRLLHRGRHLALGKVLQQAQGLDVFPLAARPEARLKEAAQGVEGRIELPSPQWGRLVQGAQLLPRRRVRLVTRVTTTTILFPDLIRDQAETGLISSAT